MNKFLSKIWLVALSLIVLSGVGFAAYNSPWVKTQALYLNNVLVTSTAAELNALDGITATPAELNLNVNQIATAVPVLSAGVATDEMDITISCKNAAGDVVAAVQQIEVWITDSATAYTITGTAASGALTAIDGGVLSALTAKKHIICVTPATGIINLSLVDTANTAGEIVCVKLPNGSFSQSAASVATDYEGGA